jgi:hypothetical protein
VKIFITRPKVTNVLPKNSISSEDIAAKVAADIALMDSIKKRVILKNNGAFPCGSGFPQYAVLLPIPNAVLHKPEKTH